MSGVIEYVSHSWGIIAFILFLLSELIGENKRIRSSSIYGLIRDFLKGESIKAKPKLEKLLDDSQK